MARGGLLTNTHAGVPRLPQTFSGQLTDCTGDRFAVIVSRYNDSITSKLCQGAVETLLDNGVADHLIDIVEVPGAWEISLVAKRLAEADVYSAIICLGAVIKGETTHDEHINRQVSLSLGEVSLQHRIPVAFGILTCNNIEQAIHRSGGNVGNKGVECAEAALEMTSLLKKVPGNK